MSATAPLRTLVTGLIAYAAAEEEMLLAAAAAADVYSLACAQAVAGDAEGAAQTLADAIALNPDVRANADRDPDLESLRGSGRLTVILAG